MKGARPKPPRRPSIVFIMADDMGYGDLGCYNPQSKIPTPNIDRLAAAGLRFTDAHSPSAVCTPTRYGVLTGRYCWRTRLEQGVIGGYDAPLIEPSRLTAASMLKAQGYATACIGKWHVGLGFHDADGQATQLEREIDFARPVTGGPRELGFDYAFFNAGCGTCAPPYGFIENDRFIDERFAYADEDRDVPKQNSGMRGASWVTQDADLLIAERACSYIDAQAELDTPFFLYLTPNAPHEPCVESVVPDFARGQSEAGARGDLVWLFDWIVGQVCDALERSGQAENTLLIITSDNGALPGDFAYDAEGKRVDAETGKREFVYHDYGHASCGDWRGYKAHIWEGGHREPLIAYWPKRILPDSVSAEPACLTDMMATWASIVGCDLPDDAAEDSYDLMPAILCGSDAGLRVGKPIREALVHHSSFGVFSIRQGDWKLVLDCPDSGGWPTPRGTHPEPGRPGQLYDLRADPKEEMDLWVARPDIVSRLSALLETYKKDGRSTPRRKTHI